VEVVLVRAKNKVLGRMLNLPYPVGQKIKEEIVEVELLEMVVWVRSRFFSISLQ
jgi:hypothetical protein